MQTDDKLANANLAHHKSMTSTQLEKKEKINSIEREENNKAANEITNRIN